MTDGIVFYRSFFEAINELEPEERLKAYESIMEYGFNGVLPIGIKGGSAIVFKMAKPQLDANAKRRENGKLGAPHGIKGGRPRNPIKTPNDNDNKKDKSNNKIKNKERDKKFTPPTLEQVEEYVSQQGYLSNKLEQIDFSKRFWDYYNAGDWSDGKGDPVANWKQKILSWVNNEESYNRQIIYGN